MRRPPLLNLLAALVLPVAILTQTGASTSPRSMTGKYAVDPNEAAIHQWLERWSKAFRAHDVTTIVSLYAPSVIAYDLVAPLQYVGRDAYAKDYQELLAQYQGPLDIEYRDLHIVADDRVGFALGLERIGGTLKNGQRSEVWVRFTSGFRKLHGTWLDVHDHVSVPADLESGKAALDLTP